MNKNPIGLLDSGVGGLTVWREITKVLPFESIAYIADSKNIPYGEKSEDTIFNLAYRLVEFLLLKKVKLIVIACNTITVSCLDNLRTQFPQVPIIGTVPVIKKAAEISINKRVGVFSTTRTSESKYQKDLIKKYARGHKVLSVGSDEIVPLIEKDKLNTQKLTKILRRALLPFKVSNVDTVCLGCTHFPFISKEIKEVLGQEIKLLEPSGAIARHVKNILANNQRMADTGNKAKYFFYTTGEKEQFERVAKNLLKIKIHAEHVTL